MAMKETAKELNSEDTLTSTPVMRALERRFDVGYIDSPKIKDIAIKKNPEGIWEMQADYEEMVPMFGNLFLLMQFQKSEPLD